MMNCRDFRIEMLDNLESRPDTRQRLELENHLAVCKACRDFSLHIHDFARLIEQEKITAFDPFMFTRIQAVLDDHYTNLRIPVFRRAIRPVLVLTALLIMIYTGILLGRGYAYQNSLNSDLETELFYISDIHTAGYKSFLLPE